MPESLRLVFSILGIVLIPVILVAAAWMFGRTLENPDSAEARRNRRIGWVVWLFWIISHDIRLAPSTRTRDTLIALVPAVILIAEQVLASWRRRHRIPSDNLIGD